MFWLLVGILLIMVASLFGLIGFGISHIWFKPQNNPEKCIVFVAGIDKPFKGHIKRINKDSITYFYNHDKKFVLVPNNYQTDYHYYRRTIYLDSLGQIIATPRLKDKTLTDDEKYDVVYEALTSDIGYGAIRAIQNPNSKNLIGVVIIVAVIVALVAGGMGYFIPHKPKIIEKPVTTENTTKIQELPPSNIIIGGE